ncbi:hypothetical protein [uncultured Endozoicomonas sp.]|uniref:hypothetical protein n=1 Tax=uncultured Endozoicomonas sp. TaxID=432652 RepID=UPI00260C58CD|nr:hypothetical protein [uncultured Endozoicomonas sp.]
MPVDDLDIPQTYLLEGPTFLLLLLEVSDRHIIFIVWRHIFDSRYTIGVPIIINNVYIIDLYGFIAFFLFDLSHLKGSYLLPDKHRVLVCVTWVTDILTGKYNLGTG